MPDDLPIQEGVVVPGDDLTWSFSRSGGPGGQHVNTTDSRARLHFALADCAALTPAVKDRLRALRPRWATEDGNMVLSSDRHRSRHRNIEDARERLAEAVREALVVQAPRKKSRPSRASQRRRVEGKKRRGQRKQMRGRVRGED